MTWELLQTRGRVRGVSCTYHRVWHDVALSEGNSLGHKETGLCVFSKIWYGGSWGLMRNANKIWGRSEVFWGVIGGFEKNAKDWRLPAKLPIGMAVDVVVRLGRNLVWEGF